MGYQLSHTRKRNNRDNGINKYGEYLTEMCISTDFRILNGRTLGDLYGEFTYCGINGYSTVDYILAPVNFIENKQIQYMRIQPLTILSDHRPVLLRINYQTANAIFEEEVISLEKIPERFIIKDMNNFKNELETSLDNVTQHQIVNEIKSCDLSEGAVDNIVNKVENIFIEIVNKCKIKVIKKNKKPRKNPWFNNHCRLLKRKLNNVCKSLNRNPSNAYTRGLFFTLKK